MSKESGFKTMGQVRKLSKVKGFKNSLMFVLAKNNEAAQVFKPILLK
jgi:hypothetical protein